MNKFKWLGIYIGLLFCSMLQAQSGYERIQTKSSYTGSWNSRQVKLVNIIPSYTGITDGRDDFTRYGTYKYLRTDSTGFFYVKKIDGRWWMIDPDGYAGINRGVTSFTTSSIQDNYDLIKRLGFNATGNFLSSEGQTKTGYNLQNYSKFAYTRRINFFLSYKNDRKKYYDTPSAVQGSLDHILVFDPKFEQYCDSLANLKVAPYADERDLLGYFTDNEINFNQDQLQNLVKDLPEGDPSRTAALEFAASEGLTESDCINYTSKVTEDIKKEFAVLLADRYYKVVADAIRKYDSNHLILGSRLHGRPRAIPGVVAASHKYMDVTSVNFYDYFTPNEQIAKETWTNDKPCIVGEFYIKDVNTFAQTQSGAGWYVQNQADRGKFYQNACLELLNNKCYIGWHYFRFQDDSDSNKGIVDLNGSEYAGMTAYMKELNEQVYRLCDFYDGAERSPQNTAEETVSFTSVADTWTIPSAESTVNNGNDAVLQICHNTLQANRQETFLKFDMSSAADKLANIKHAQLEISAVATERNKRRIFASGIFDTAWEELTLTGAVQNANDDWRLGYNRIDSYYGVLKNEEQYVFDVTAWVSDKIKEGSTVSLKLHELLSNTTPLQFASKEHSNATFHPKLVITFRDASSGASSISDDNDIRIRYHSDSGRITIQSAEDFSAQLYTVCGQYLLKSNAPEIDISDYASGIYLLRINTDKGKVQTLKLIR